MRGAGIAALSTAIALGAALAETGQYTHWSQPHKGPRNKPGNSLVKARKKAKARRTAQRAARRAK